MPLAERLLTRAFYDRPTATVARELPGKLLVRRMPDGQELRARIVEVEAYLGEKDQASHARFGRTARAGIMFGAPGHLYVYLIYGMYHCMNVVTESEGTAGAVLIRAAERVGGDDPAELRGPGKLCRALGITMSDKGIDLTRPEAPLVLCDDGHRPPRVATSARVGIDYAGPWTKRQLRFFVPGNPAVSGPRR